MIVADTTNLILGSPVISVILGGMGTGIVGVLIGVFRVLSRIQLIETQIIDIGKTVSDLKHDMDVIKWGAVASATLSHQQYPPTPLEQP